MNLEFNKFVIANEAANLDGYKELGS